MTNTAKSVLAALLLCVSVITNAGEPEATLMEPGATLAPPPEGMGYLALFIHSPSEMKSVRFSVKGERTVMFKHSVVPAGRTLYLWQVPAGSYCLEKFYANGFRFEPNSSDMLCFDLKAGALNYPGTVAWHIGGVGLDMQVDKMLGMLGDLHPSMLALEIPWHFDEKEYPLGHAIHTSRLASIGRQRGDDYRTGDGVKRDPVKALEWYKLAAQKGEARAAALVCQQLDLGLGVPADPVTAVEYCRLAVAKEDPVGAWMLARLHARSHGGLTPDAVEEKRLMDMAGAPDRLAENIIRYSWGDRDGNKQYPDGAEMYRLATAWLASGSERGAYALGHYHQYGVGVPVDAAKAAEFFDQAARGGMYEGWKRIADMYWYGQNVPVDEAKSVPPLERYAEREGDYLNEVAWRLAIARDPAVRNGKKAVDYAWESIKRRGPKANDVDTLAAAYAANGEFDKAAKTQREAIKLMKDADWKDEDIAEAKARLALYKNGAPYVRELPAPVPAPAN